MKDGKAKEHTTPYPKLLTHRNTHTSIHRQQPVKPSSLPYGHGHSSISESNGQPHILVLQSSATSHPVASVFQSEVPGT